MIEAESIKLYSEPEKPAISTLVITFSIADKGDGKSTDQYDMDMVGAIPLMELIGYIGKVQRGLHEPAQCRYQDCTERVLVVQWFRDHRRFGWYTHKDTPIDGMCGMLEMVKQTLVLTIRNQHGVQAQRRPSIVGLDGRPVQ